MLNYWIDITQATTMLAFEAQEVIGLRLAKLACGGQAAVLETGLMMSEKAEALVETAMSVACGGSSQSVIDSYRKKVQANRVRLAA